ncbi:MAG TPA: dihydroorotate dehydrogenase electron transfer subunit [Candidatus Thermoplasmatota archaeon]|nr:dihydroorotate dehydrogenase electron transfer subunit [Candidatus Thermoplasmatota archaeon]
MDSSRTVRVLGSVRDSSRHVTLSFADPPSAGYEPGQFVMVWVPGVDEVPMALWGGGKEPLKILVEGKGDCTKVLVEKKKGDLIGVRGPYGKPFQLRGRRILVVVGGTGTSPLVPFCERARGKAQIDVVIGGRTKEFVLLRAAFEAAGAKVHVSTDDGSEGFHGRAPDLAKQFLDKTGYDDVLTCGPERMMRAIVDECERRGISCQASVERWMKCAVGICDACLVDGIRLCRDGPVLPRESLVRLEDFGRFEREPSGVRKPLH